MAEENADVTAVEFYDLVASKFDTSVNEMFYEAVAQRLMGFVDLENVDTIVEVGAGSGFSTRKIIDRFPKAHVMALEPAETLLGRGELKVPAAKWVDERLEDFQVEDQVDLAVSSMAFHWLSALERRKFMGIGQSAALAIPVSGQSPIAEGHTEADGTLNSMLTRLLRDLKVKARWPREARQGQLVVDQMEKSFKRVESEEFEFTESFGSHELFLNALHSRGVLFALSDTQLKHARRALHSLLGDRKPRFSWSIRLVVGYG